MLTSSPQCRLFAIAFVLLAGFCRLTAQPGQLSGAIYTSDVTGTSVNANIFASPQAVYLMGGPQNSQAQGLPDGTYYFQVTNPSGSVLLSQDPAAARQLVVVNGRVAGAAAVTGAHANGSVNPANLATGVQLWPYLPTPNDGGEYKVWLITQSAATIDETDARVLHFQDSDAKTDNFKVVIDVAPSAALTAISLSPTPSTITYGANQSYTVSVTSSNGTPTGAITISVISSSTAVAAGPLTLVNGAASYTFSGLPAGTYTVGAHYTSDSSSFSDSTAAAASLLVKPAPLTVSADDKTKVYGAADPALTWTYVSGLIGSDTTSVITGALTRAAGENVAGSPYAITKGTLAAGPNYLLTATPGILAITKANPTISVAAYAVTYDGNAHTATGSVTGVNGEALSGLVLSGTTHTDAGATTDTWTFTDTTGNYNDASGSVADVINKANPTINVTGYSGVYDNAAHSATGTASGVKGEDLSSLLSLGSAFINAPGGTASWNFSGNNNYNPASGTAAIVITQAPSTTSVTGGTFAYDGVAHGATSSVTGINLTDTAPITYIDSNNVVLAGAPVTPGTYTATGNYAGDTNHVASSGSATITIVGGAITATKFYDVNTNGAFDSGEAVIKGWKIVLTGKDNLNQAVSQAGYTQADGTVTFSGLMVGSYTVSEAASVTGSWVATRPTSVAVSLTGLGAMTGSATFGNVSLGAGGGLTIGFWSNKNGDKTLTGSAGSLAALKTLSLRNANGSDFDPATNASYQSWLLSANATNMAYMLSAQLSAMYNNVNVRPNSFGGVNGAALIVAPGALGANAAGFMTVTALINEANASLGANGLTTTAGSTRTYQEALKTALDKGNNGLNFVQPVAGAFSF